MADATQTQDTTNQNTGAVADDAKDDAALWDEIEQSEAGAAATDDATEPKPSDKDGTGSADDPAAAAGKDDKIDDSAAPADKAQSVDAGKPAAAQAQPDVWANAPPELKAQFDAVQEQVRKGEQYRRSNEGRVSALQRQIDELSRKAAPAKAADKGKANDEGVIDDAALKAVAEEYPDIANPFVKVISQLQEQVTRQGKELSAIGTERRQTALNEQAEILTEQHPDWQTVTADPRLKPWLDNQPRHIREALFRNANEIVDADEAADVVGRFKGYLAAQGTAQDQTTAQSSAPAARVNETPKVLTGKRQLQLESASTARSRGPGAASGIAEDGDPEHIWKQFDEQERRQAKRA